MWSNYNKLNEIRKMKYTLLRALIFLKSGRLEYHRKSNCLQKTLKKGTKGKSQKGINHYCSYWRTEWVTVLISVRKNRPLSAHLHLSCIFVFFKTSLVISLEIIISIFFFLFSFILSMIYNILISKKKDTSHCPHVLKAPLLGISIFF